MDDMIFQCNNQNSVYVLNSNYNSFGQEFPHLNLIKPIGTKLDSLSAATVTNEKDSATTSCHQYQQQQQHSLASAAKSANRNCSSVSRILQHKLKTLGNFNDNNATEAIGNPVVPSTSSTSTTCLPAAAAIQKLFNCSSVANNILNSSCNNFVSSSTSISGNIYNSSSKNNNKNGSRDRDCLSSMTGKRKDNGLMDTGAILGNCINNNNSNNTVSSSRHIGNASGSKKKCSNVKSTLIAKKTKFWKFLEEEKWRSNDDSIENLITTNCERQNSATSKCCSLFSTSSKFHDNSCVKKSSSTSSAQSLSPTSASGSGGRQTTTMTACGPSTFNSNKHYSNNKNASTTSEQQQEPQQQQNKSRNWSGNHDSNNQKQEKSSYELYKEAAELLGLSCTLCDNCRCLDCQSGYFDCDDSDSYSELSYMDEYDDDVATQNAMALFMHAEDYYDDMTATSYCEQQQQLQQHEHECTDANCNMNESNESADAATTVHNDDVDDDDDDSIDGNAFVTVKQDNSNKHQQSNEHEQQQQSGGESINPMRISQRPSELATQIAMFPRDDGYDYEGNSSNNKIAAIEQLTSSQWRGQQQQQQSNELENCASFNELSLIDANTRTTTEIKEQQQ